MQTIPFLNLTKLHAPIRHEIGVLTQEIIDESQFIGGPQVSHFNRQFAQWVGPGSVSLGCGNGTDAITLAARALRLPEGSEAIIPAMTFFATAEGLLNAGLKLKLVDITPDTWLMDINKLAPMLTPKVKLLVPVHLYGQMAPMDSVRQIADKHGCAVLEDSAQAHGALWKNRPVGFWGDIASFSFFPGKNLGAFGDAGAVLTRKPELIEEAYRLANHGGIKKYEHDIIGSNSRLDSLQAAVLNVKLNYIDAWNERRNEIAQIYLSELSRIPALTLPTVCSESRHVFHLFVVQVPKRTEFMSFLNERGVQTGIHYPIAIHQLPALAKESFAQESFPNAEKLAAHGVSLPMCPTLTDNEVKYVVDTVRAFFA